MVGGRKIKAISQAKDFSFLRAATEWDVMAERKCHQEFKSAFHPKLNVVSLSFPFILRLNLFRPLIFCYLANDVLRASDCFFKCHGWYDDRDWKEDDFVHHCTERQRCKLFSLTCFLSLKPFVERFPLFTTPLHVGNNDRKLTGVEEKISFSRLLMWAKPMPAAMIFLW
jgi:hypothetical protein